MIKKKASDASQLDKRFHKWCTTQENQSVSTSRSI